MAFERSVFEKCEEGQNHAECSCSASSQPIMHCHCRWHSRGMCVCVAVNSGQILSERVMGCLCPDSGHVGEHCHVK